MSDNFNTVTESAQLVNFYYQNNENITAATREYKTANNIKTTKKIKNEARDERIEFCNKNSLPSKKGHPLFLKTYYSAMKLYLRVWSSIKSIDC